MIVAIVGPTGVGKTKLSIKLAKKYNAEIINFDSIQIYKKMDIASAKVTEKEMDGIIHHLIDIKDPTENYSVYDYQKDARKILNTLIKNKKNVILVGGTGLYLKALLFDYRFNYTHNKKDFSMYSNTDLYEMVIKKDPNTKIHINNRQRLESFLNNYTENKEYNENKLLYESFIIGLTVDRKKLYSIIDKRVDLMVANGLIDEAKYFYNSKINSKAVNTIIGYKELYPYFDNNKSLDECINLIKQKSRNYAKRQYTFFNNKLNVKWFNVDLEDFDKTVSEIFDYIKKTKNIQK